MNTDHFSPREPIKPRLCITIINTLTNDPILTIDGVIEWSKYKIDDSLAIYIYINENDYVVCYVHINENVIWMSYPSMNVGNKDYYSYSILPFSGNQEV